MTDHNRLSPEEIAALKKLDEILARHNVTVFDEREIRVIRQMMEFYQACSALGRFAGAARNVVIWMGVMLGAWWAFNEWVVKFVKSAVSQ